ncbi:carboxypeptidase-like regulatory domain-containing protein [Halopiger djelfimassiliensis]|uniref:carboxypeptidase-like regulatory domain-containing protein n=1 Tax=Halopiger djelfimassiliensis TaxID=1293047 RepID=UPI00067795D3|nr:carboxypeptidase-like regulatory domain-containing protein [Halopiger djelfimassiliensis]
MESITVETDNVTTVSRTLLEDHIEVSGYVTDVDDNPIEGVNVSIGNEEHMFTGDDGYYEFTLPGTVGHIDYTLTAKADGYQTEYERLSLEEGDRVTKNLTLEETGSVINGTITDPTGDPVPHAFVSVADEEVTTDAAGNYEITVTSGDYTLEVIADGFKDATESVSVGPGENATVDLTLENADGTVVGTVTDTDGEPIEDATVTVADEEPSTDADGTFEVDLPVDYDFTVYTVTVSADGYETVSKDVTIAPEKTTAVPVELTPADPSEIDFGVTIPDDFEVDDLCNEVDDLEAEHPLSERC